MSVGGGGLEFLPFYLYGLPTAGYPPVTPTDWDLYGFGTPAFHDLFKSSLQAAQTSGARFDFAVGANQGAGVPAVVETPGLSMELVR